MSLIPELEREIEAAVGRRIAATRAAAPAPAPARPWRRRRRMSRRAALVLAATLLLAATAALAAGGVIPIGAPVSDPPGTPKARPNVGIGTVVPGTTKLLALRAEDPDGGPPWGMRISSTTRGLGCLTPGRVVAGRLGVLGRDGLFGNDGQFHALPAQRSGLFLGCRQLDAGGRLFLAASLGAVPMAGMADGACMPARLTRGAARSALCPDADLRDVFYGALGPGARSVTYRAEDGRERTVDVLAPYGAYLIVLRTSPTSRFAGAGGGSPIPYNSPITKIAFADGRSCAVVISGFARGPRSCPLPGHRPLPAPRISAADVTAPVRVRIERRGGRRVMVVRFRARVAVADASNAYTISRRRRGARGWASGATRRDIRAGTVVEHVFYGVAKGAVYTGQVRYQWGGDGPLPVASRATSALVGRYAFRVR